MLNYKLKIVKVYKKMNNDKELIPFLRNLANSIESKNLTNQQLERISEFFMSYQFKEDISNEDEYSPEELVKFLFLGWYIYSHILKENKVLEA